MPKTLAFPLLNNSVANFFTDSQLPLLGVAVTPLPIKVNGISLFI